MVYGDACYFGEKQGIWKVGDFNLQRLMISNYIDACAIIRKSVLEKIGFYDAQMKFMGWEDWDMWLRIAFAGYDFYYIGEVLFDYRVTNVSMSGSFHKEYEFSNTMENYINSKYPSRMGQQWILDKDVNRFKQSPFLFLIKLFLKAYFPKYYNKLLLKNKIRNGL